MTRLLPLLALVPLFQPCWLDAAEPSGRPPPSRVDFSYAFATPHRLTVARPDSSDKTLLDLQPGSLRVAWSYDDLLHYPLASFKTPPAAWAVRLTPEVSGKPFATSRWARVEGHLPALDNFYESPGGSMRLEVAGGASAALIRVQLTNTGDQPQQFSLRCESSHWGENPAWVDPTRWPGETTSSPAETSAPTACWCWALARTGIRSPPTADRSARRRWCSSGT